MPSQTFPLADPGDGSAADAAWRHHPSTPRPMLGQEDLIRTSSAVQRSFPHVDRRLNPDAVVSVERLDPPHEDPA